jgi:hypothetical protein
MSGDAGTSGGAPKRDDGRGRTARPSDPDIGLDAAKLELLERHKPVLRFDPQYDYRLLAAESAVDNPGNLLRRRDGEVIARAGGEPQLGIGTLADYPAGLEPEGDDCLSMAPDHPGDSRRMEREEGNAGRVYGRVVEEPDGRRWLQYWFWLYYNPKNLFGFGKHEGDWEMIQVGLGADEQPQGAGYAQHDSGEARPWRAGAIEFSPLDPRRPVVYVAPLSHASYFEPGTHLYLLGIDHPFNDGPAAAELPLVPFGDWVHWPGRWGNSERTVGGRIGNGPPSPRWQREKWERPGAWHRRLRYRRLRVRLGRLIHAVGGRTFPRPPTVTEARAEGGRVRVAWELKGRGPRRGRHLYITLHERHFVIASRIVRRAETTSATTLQVPPGRAPTAVMVSAFNGLRQRSDIAEATILQAAGP